MKSSIGKTNEKWLVLNKETLETRATPLSKASAAHILLYIKERFISFIRAYCWRYRCITKFICETELYSNISTNPLKAYSQQNAIYNKNEKTYVRSWHQSRQRRQSG